MALLADPRTETVRLAAHGIALAEGAAEARLRPEAVADLAALQHAAQASGQPLRVQSGFLRPTQAEADHALPTAWLQPCALQQTPLSPELSVKDEPPTGLQHWLGTVVTFSDDADGWLLDHASDYGFVPSLPENGTDTAFQPRTWRWVGQPVAARIRPVVGAADYPDRLRTELGRALAELNAPEPTFWGQQDRCWVTPTLTGRGCAARWYFLPLPGF